MEIIVIGVIIYFVVKAHNKDKERANEHEAYYKDQYFQAHGTYNGFPEFYAKIKKAEANKAFRRNAVNVVSKGIFLNRKQITEALLKMFGI